MTVGRKIEALVGVQAYFGVAAALARAFSGEEAGPQRVLFAECIKAVIQSECYVYQKRGFSDSKVFQEDWDMNHPNNYAVSSVMGYGPNVSSVTNMDLAMLKDIGWSVV